MADNYLENQYEQYQARKAAWEKAKNPARYKRYISRHFPSKRRKESFRDRRCRGIGKAIVEAFCKLNYQVAFCDKNELKDNKPPKPPEHNFTPST